MKPRSYKNRPLFSWQVLWVQRNKVLNFLESSPEIEFAKEIENSFFFTETFYQR